MTAPGAARRQDRREPARLRGAPPRPLGPRGGLREAGRGGPAQRVRARARRRPQALVALDPRRRARPVDAGLPGRRAAVGHQHGGAGPGALARVRGPQRERPPGLPALRAAQPGHRPPRGRDAAAPATRSSSRCATAIGPTSCSTTSARPCRPGPSGPTGAWRAGCARRSRSSATTTSPSWPTSPPVGRSSAGRRRASARTPWSSSAASTGSRMTPCIGLGAVLVRPQPAAVRPRPDRPAGPRRHLATATWSSDPREAFEPVLNLLGLRFTRRPDRPHRRPGGVLGPKVPLDIDPRVRAVCADLEERLDDVARAHQRACRPVPPAAARRAEPSGGRRDRHRGRPHEHGATPTSSPRATTDYTRQDRGPLAGRGPGRHRAGRDRRVIGRAPATSSWL